MKCLCCGKEIKDGTVAEKGWHRTCIRSFFGTESLPLLDVSKEELEELAKKTTERGFTVPGVQKKLSLHLSREGMSRLTLVDYPTGYILKPQAPGYTALPEAENLVMHMAEAAGIACVPHALIRTSGDGGEFAYITKRIDRVFPSGKNSKMKKLAMEDFCQLGMRLTEDKYRGSYEKCAGIVKRHSDRMGLDLADLYYRVLFFFITGNADMHLKNFSLIETESGSRQYVLSPAYDMLPVNIVLPQDKEELALTLNGKKMNMRRNDFLKFAAGCGIDKKAAINMMNRILTKKEQFLKMCMESYMPEEMKEALAGLISDRAERLHSEGPV